MGTGAVSGTAGVADAGVVSDTEGVAGAGAGVVSDIGVSGRGGERAGSGTAGVAAASGWCLAPQA
ncbi:MAG: hypothetical protein LBK25_01025 [Treponema sp.]|nr:hypothetical protein [Treponema sp.]